MQVGPHPHIGLQTVTWLLEGEVLHTDSIGSEQLIRPGQLNLMTAGRGVAHAEAAQPGGTRLARHPALGGAARGNPRRCTRLRAPRRRSRCSSSMPPWRRSSSASSAGTRSPARHDSPIVGADVALRPGTSVVPLRSGVGARARSCLEGVVDLDGETVKPGQLAYLGLGRDELPIQATDKARVLLVGGEPFGEQIVMWWNFVGRTREEMVAARADWEGHGDRGSPTCAHRSADPGPGHAVARADDSRAVARRTSSAEPASRTRVSGSLTPRGSCRGGRR